MRFQDLIFELLFVLLAGCASTLVDPPTIATHPKEKTVFAPIAFSRSVQGLEAQIKSIAERQEELIARVPAVFPVQSEARTTWIWVLMSIVGVLLFGLGFYLGKRSRPKDSRPVSRPQQIPEAALQRPLNSSLSVFLTRP